MSRINQQYFYSQIAKKYNVTYSDGAISEDQCNVNGSTKQLEDQIQNEASQWLYIENFISIIPLLFSTLLLGAYSDKGGRKIGMIVPLTGYLVYTIIAEIVCILELPFWIIMIGSSLSGLTGGITTLSTACYSYIADITTQQQRSFRISIIVIGECLGLALLQVSIGFCIKFLGFSYTYLLILIICLLCLIYSIFLVTETVVKQKNTKIFSIEHIKKPLVLICKDNGTNRLRKVQLALVIISLFILVHEGNLSGVLTLYLYASPFCMDSVGLGIFTALLAVVQVFGLMTIFNCFKKYIQETCMMILGCVSFIAFLILIGLATNKTAIYSAPFMGVAALLTIALARSTASKLIEPNEQGSLFASISWLVLVAALIGNVSFVNIYDYTLDRFHGFTYFLGAGITAVNMCLCIVLHCCLRNTSTISITQESTVNQSP